MAKGKTIKIITKAAAKKKQQRRRSKANNGGATRSRGDIVLAQGTGHVASRPFGSTKGTIPRSCGLHSQCWNAFHTAHAPLPRSVGPYTVVRTSFLTQTSAKSGFIGTFKRNPVNANTPSPGVQNYTPGGWSNCVMVTQENQGPIGSTSATGYHFSPFPGGAPAEARQTTTFTCCPSAISVQIIGPQSLSDAAGQIAAAVVPARLNLADDTRGWPEVQTDITSYFRPRLLSAGKLTLRGVQMDSHPLSMTDVSSFEALIHDTPNPNEAYVSPWTETAPYPCGWAPMAFVNPTGAPLQMLISVEWRVRFDISNPAVSSHQHHGVTSDAGWDSHIRRASAALPGVLDIVEKVANTGIGLYKGAAMAGMI